MMVGAPDETRNADPKLYGASGDQPHLLADFTKQPCTAALIALAVGDLLGTIT
jgi:hypothetical protein